MKGSLVAVGGHKAVTVMLAATVVGGCGVVPGSADGSRTATVTGVVDGDTIDVRYDGEEHRIRLLNIDTPESVDPNRPVECLGPEASQWLQQRLPAGTEVRLEYDQEVVDGYGRDLAAVFLGDDLVNADIARAGLGVPMSIEPNTKYLPPVQDAHAEARYAGRGLHSPTLECALPTQVGQIHRRPAEEEAARRAAEAKREAERTTNSSGTPQTTSAPTRSSSDSGSELSEYTGCRSYAPGGETWTPFPC